MPSAAEWLAIGSGVAGALISVGVLAERIATRLQGPTSAGTAAPPPAAPPPPPARESLTSIPFLPAPPHVCGECKAEIDGLRREHEELKRDVREEHRRTNKFRERMLMGLADIRARLRMEPEPLSAEVDDGDRDSSR